MSEAPGVGARSQRAARRTALICAAFVATMLGLAYAAVPLYALFCRATGFDGTPRVATQPATSVGARIIQVRFDANVAPGLPWRFAPEQPDIDVKPGETHTVTPGATRCRCHRLANGC